MDADKKIQPSKLEKTKRKVKTNGGEGVGGPVAKRHTQSRDVTYIRLTDGIHVRLGFD